ncbi:MAG TPA: FtsW/RodA/SpoVE family cell cycle protein, partial [Alphaproteobacteria bacterium]|nr:FtsW/RodA/SpoVE family cell cycle protein [Alphaproteobacteria bacterium]
MAVLSLGIDSRRYLRNFNWPLAIAPLLIAILGVLCIQSADLHDPDASGEYKKQFLYILLGLPLMVGFSLIDYRNWRRWAPGLYVFNLLLLGFILRGGHSALGAQRWISLGPLGTFQPSEPAKLVLAISIAYVLCRHTYDRIQDLWKPLLTAAIPALLILKQPDLGTSLVIGAILTVQL